MRIGLLSDTHGHLDAQIVAHLSGCDEIWHAGDFGGHEIARHIESLAPLRGVFGNIDPPSIRKDFPEAAIFEVEGLTVLMIHIGGYPDKYTTKARHHIARHHPGLFISGHSHILKVMSDKRHNLLHINPGAAGYEGFHQMRTMVTFEVSDGKVSDLRVIELGHRSTLERVPNIIE